MQVWTVANQKGGVGKTTTSVALGGLLTQQGQRVLLVDVDPHGSLSCYFRQNPDTVTHGTYTLFEERKKLSVELLGQLIVTTPYAGLSLLPASTALATLERKMIGQDGMGLVISRALNLLQDDFDTVIIDCPPLLGVLLINALAACDQLLIPVQTEFLALKGLERMLRTLQMMSRSRKRDLPYLIIPTMFDRRTHASVSSLRAMRNTYGVDVWPGKIPVDTKLRDASEAGIPPHVFSPDTRGTEAYSSLVNQLIAGKFTKTLAAAGE